jgi:ribonucleoside-diphosphate reductase alpha chain
MTRPEVMQGRTDALETGSGRVYVTVNYYEGVPVETFVMLGRAGSEERALTEALGRVISTSLQRGVPLTALTKQLRGISSEQSTGLGPNKVLSVADAVGRILETHTHER